MNKPELNDLNSRPKENVNDNKKSINSNQDPTYSTDLGNAQSGIKNSDTKVSNQIKISHQAAAKKESTSVDIKVPKQVSHPDLFKSNVKNVTDFNSLVKSWENSSDNSKQNCVKNNKKITVKINNSGNELTIELNGRAFPFHPFRQN